MARPVTMTIPHALGKAEARRRVERGFTDIQRSLGVPAVFSTRQHWEDDRLLFEVSGLGQSLAGRLDVRADTVEIQLDLPGIFAALADTVLAKLRDGTRKLLA